MMPGAFRGNERQGAARSGPSFCRPCHPIHILPAENVAPYDHQRLRAVFDHASLLDRFARDAYLDAACVDEPALRAHVARLLAAHDELTAFLERPVAPPPTAPDAAPFADTERFRALRQLGAGGMGVVYEAHDRLRDEVVALKTLRRAGAGDLYRLKREFRGLADVTHANLVCLYELFVAEEQSFFTMELVKGVSFVEFVRGPADAGFSCDRLELALRQLSDGVTALHRRGKLHRDLKPSNVLVTAEGRVVILDFGLTAEAGAREGIEEWGAGTPAYMSPEETAGAPPSEASDWYAVGVMLYEALTGTLPFGGSLSNLLRDKRESDPVAPADIARDVPPTLNALCMGLLRRSPADRLTGTAVAEALAPTRASSDSGAPQETQFIGRDSQLASLAHAHAAVATGVRRSVVIYGPSGIGKSALIRRFISQLPADDVVVLTGRCYENESVPYKALDGVVDALSRHLGPATRDDLAGIAPVDLAAATRLFPVLLQVDAIAGTVRGEEHDVANDPLRVRRRAIEALNLLLAAALCLAHRLNAGSPRRSLVIWIDDLQWSDADSMMLLEELVRLPSPTPMLTLLGFRQEEIGNKPFLRTLVDRVGQPEWSAVPLEPMSDDEARMLVSTLVSRRTALTGDERERITREANGSPLVLEQLALYAGAHDGTPTFAGMFESRLNALALEERRFLETVAVCGRPVAPDIVCDAADVAHHRQSLVVRLRASRLIRSSGSSDSVETYHDRIREVVAGRLAAEATREIHGRMAASLVARQSDDCEALFEHYRGAGDAERASSQARLAAAKASAALAFDRAASFFRHAIELTPSADAVVEWREQLATALTNAGRPAEAADAYLTAAAAASRASHVELQRRAAEQWLTGGHIDRGLDLIRQVLAEVGLRWINSPRAAVGWVVWRRARLWWRGLHFQARPVDSIDPEVLLRLDTCWAAGTGLALVDTLSASNFVAQHLHMALDVGEPSRIARGVALEWAARHADWHFRNGAGPLHALSTELGEHLGTPQARAMVALADSMAAIGCGRWKQASAASERALSILRDECVGLTWETTIAQNIFLWGLMYRGEMAELSRRVPALLDDARRRGNLYLATEVCTRSNFVWLAADDPDGGERETADAMAQWSRKGFHRQHYSALLARVQTALYRGDAASAWRLLDEQHADLRRSMLDRLQAVRVELSYLHARCAIAVARADASKRRFLKIARRYAARIARERMPWSTPIGLLLQGGIASVEGSQDVATAHLQEALMQFDRADMQLYAAVTKRRLGALRRDAEGQRLQREAEAWMAAQQIKNPVSFSRMFAPGFADDPVLPPA
jgi:eukaryotic-like serine/threonine-protein kinase